MQNVLSNGIKALTLLSLLSTASPAAAQVVTPAHEPSYQELLQILKRAEAAPNPAEESAQPLRAPGGAGSPIEYDMATGKPRVVPRGAAPQKQGAVDPGNPGAGAPLSAGGKRAGADDTVAPELQMNPAITPTKPSPTTAVTTFPFNSVFKMLMRYRVGASDFYWLCSASARGSFHLLTAGHCIYSWDPNNDKNTSDRKWADEIWVWAAQTDRVAPIGTLDFPYGVAKATFLRSYTQWTQSQDLNYDYGLITLDRRQGTHTGWMAAESTVGTSLNFDGYPTETPYVPAGEYRQYPGFNSNNVSSSTSTRINLDAFTYGGHSGGPAWRFSSSTGERWVEGINSTSDRAGSAGETRVNSSIIDDFTADRSTDESVRPPVARPNLIEYLFPTDAKDLLTNSVDQGQAISVKYNLFNAGFVPAPNVTVDFYLSTDTTISTADSLIGTRTYSSLDAFTFAINTTSFVVPTSQPVGDYYVGWIMRTTGSEPETDDNTVLISTETVHVNQRPLPPEQVTNLIDPSGNTIFARPIFKWSPTARAASYVLSVWQNGKAVFVGAYSASKLYCASGGTCHVRLAPADALKPGYYRWRVRAQNPVGKAAASPFEPFRVLNSSKSSVADARD